MNGPTISQKFSLFTPRLLLATRNAHKRKEIGAILGSDYYLEDLSDYPSSPEVAETGQSFEENATLKALSASAYLATELTPTSKNLSDDSNKNGYDSSLVVIADDSGLVVPALGGAPGIYSARYAGDNATDQQNLALLLEKMKYICTTERNAFFICTLVIASAGKKIAAFEGQLKGKIAEVPSGQEGFGYDPIFIPEGYLTTLAELPSDEKNRISHRYQAIRKLENWLQNKMMELSANGATKI